MTTTPHSDSSPPQMCSCVIFLLAPNTFNLFLLISVISFNIQKRS